MSHRHTAWLRSCLLTLLFPRASVYMSFYLKRLPDLENLAPVSLYHSLCSPARLLFFVTARSHSSDPEPSSQTL